MHQPNTTSSYPTFTPTVGLKVHSTLPPDRWESLLTHYPDPEFPKMTAGIAHYGARVGYEGPILRIRRPNHSSVLCIPSEISNNIAPKVEASRIQEIHSLPQFYYVSLLGAVKNQSNGGFNGWRRIHDLSCPNGKSVNDGIKEH